MVLVKVFESSTIAIESGKHNMVDLKFLEEEWPTISRRLDEALLIAPRERDTWIDSIHENDSIKAKLRNLLSDAVGVETDDFLGSLPKLTLGIDEKSSDSGAHDAVLGALIGPYRLIRELGVGGMGAVWLAERIDGGLKRQVALKLPRMNWSRGLAERMSRERDILASLDHPNIARIYDAGLDEQGRPYLALEYVEGEPINVYCKQHALSVRARLLLVLQVSRAVAHAHARLVVHRDLKPANILVNAEGQVRLLDFGIAKLMEGALTQETQLTQQSGRALTLDYASPEQIRGEPIGTASDVYSLGIVAYELLTEAKPYQLKRQSAAALEEAIASVDVRLASSACSNKAFCKDLRGDLDAILNKALKKSVTERYPTVDAFAQDIERYLANLPVKAQADHWSYRAVKFLRRRRLPVALASAAATILLASASFALWQAHIASAQRDRALALLSRNEAITEFLEVFVAGSALSNRPMKLSDMLERSEVMAEKQFRDTPEDRAVVFAMLGKYHQTLGQADKAEALLKRAVHDSRESNDMSLKARMTCQYATAIEMFGRIDEARRNLQSITSQIGIDAETASECLSYLAYIAGSVGDGQESVDYAKRALERLHASHRPSPVRLASITAILAYGLHLSGRNDEANREFATSLQIFSRLGREASAEAIQVRSNWGHIVLGAGNAKGALTHYDEILALVAQNGGGEPPAYLLTSRANALALSGRYGEALTAFSIALALAEKDGHPSRQAYCLIALGVITRELGELQRAQSYLLRVEHMDKSVRPEGGPIAAAEHLLRARIALSQKNLTLARNEFTAVMAGRKRNGSTVNALIGRAEVALLDNQLELGLADAQDALQMSKLLQGGTAYSVTSGRAWLVLGEIQTRTNGVAPDAFAAAVDHLTHTVDASHPALKRAQTLALAGAEVK
jgi:eukaryotic-like serine/threonine-protein kinase